MLAVSGTAKDLQVRQPERDRQEKSAAMEPQCTPRKETVMHQKWASSSSPLCFPFSFHTAPSWPRPRGAKLICDTSSSSNHFPKPRGQMKWILEFWGGTNEWIQETKQCPREKAFKTIAWSRDAGSRARRFRWAGRCVIRARYSPRCAQTCLRGRPSGRGHRVTQTEETEAATATVTATERGGSNEANNPLPHPALGEHRMEQGGTGVCVWYIWYFFPNLIFFY